LLTFGSFSDILMMNDTDDPDEQFSVSPTAVAGAQMFTALPAIDWDPDDVLHDP
jgi:hypothetical protein